MKKSVKLFVLISAIAVSFSANAQTKRNVKQEEANKKMAVNFYQQLFGDHDYTVIDKYVDENYIQHNPSLPDGRAALANAVPLWLKDLPKSKIDIQRVAADGDLVILHIKMPGANGKTTALVDIFRIKNNKIIGHWDVMQETPEKSANTHPMF